MISLIACIKNKNMDSQKLFVFDVRFHWLKVPAKLTTSCRNEHSGTPTSLAHRCWAPQADVYRGKLESVQNRRFIDKKK
jgi:hypothetical protein